MSLSSFIDRILSVLLPEEKPPAPKPKKTAAAQKAPSAKAAPAAPARSDEYSAVMEQALRLINGRGDPGETYVKLEVLWLSCRGDLPQLDRTLPLWLFHWSLLHGLRRYPPIPDDMTLAAEPTFRDALVHSHSADRPLKLPFPLLCALCTYSVTGSSFYQDGHQALMREALPRAAALADAALIRKTGGGILAAYGPAQAEKRTVVAYGGAALSGIRRHRFLNITVRPYTAWEPLQQYMNELVRYTENRLRVMYGHRGRLRNLSLDSETAALIDAFLQKEYSPEPEASHEPAPAPVGDALDFASIDALRAQSDAVREALEVELPEEPEELPDLEPLPVAVPETGEDPVAALVTVLTPVQRDVLMILLEGGGADRLAALAEQTMTLPELLIDSVNDAAVPYLDDLLIDAMGDEPRILEEYEPALRRALKQED